MGRHQPDRRDHRQRAEGRGGRRRHPHQHRQRLQLRDLYRGPGPDRHRHRRRGRLRHRQLHLPFRRRDPDGQPDRPDRLDQCDRLRRHQCRDAERERGRRLHRPRLRGQQHHQPRHDHRRRRRFQLPVPARREPRRRHHRQQRHPELQRRRDHRERRRGHPGLEPHRLGFDRHQPLQRQQRRLHHRRPEQQRQRRCRLWPGRRLPDHRRCDRRRPGPKPVLHERLDHPDRDRDHHHRPAQRQRGRRPDPRPGQCRRRRRQPDGRGRRRGRLRHQRHGRRRRRHPDQWRVDRPGRDKSGHRQPADPRRRRRHRPGQLLLRDRQRHRRAGPGDRRRRCVHRRHLGHRPDRRHRHQRWKPVAHLAAGHQPVGRRAQGQHLERPGLYRDLHAEPGQRGHGPRPYLRGRRGGLHLPQHGRRHPEWPHAGFWRHHLPDVGHRRRRAERPRHNRGSAERIRANRDQPRPLQRLRRAHGADHRRRRHHLPQLRRLRPCRRGLRGPCEPHLHRRRHHPERREHHRRFPHRLGGRRPHPGPDQRGRDPGRPHGGRDGRHHLRQQRRPRADWRYHLRLGRRRVDHLDRRRDRSGPRRDHRRLAQAERSHHNHPGQRGDAHQHRAFADQRGQRVAGRGEQLHRHLRSGGGRRPDAAQRRQHRYGPHAQRFLQLRRRAHPDVRHRQHHHHRRWGGHLAPDRVRGWFDHPRRHDRLARRRDRRRQHPAQYLHHRHGPDRRRHRLRRQPVRRWGGHPERRQDRCEPPQRHHQRRHQPDRRERNRCGRPARDRPGLERDRRRHHAAQCRQYRARLHGRGHRRDHPDRLRHAHPNRLVASAAGNITLYDGVNNVATIGGLASVSGDIVYRDVDSFDLQGDITANSAFRGVMLVAAGSGTITQTSGVLDVGYFRGVTGGSITLGGANQIRRLISTLIGNGALTLNTTTGLSVDGTVSANTVSLTSAGAITQANNAQIWTTTLNASAVTGINLAYSGFGANNIGNLGVISNTTSGGITIANSYPFMNLTGNITAAGQAVSLSNAMAGITQTGGIVTADTLSLSATGGISVTGNNLVGSLGAVTAGGNFAFTNVGDIDLTGNVDVGANTVSLISTIGHIFQPGGIITANVLNLSAGGSGGISLNRANAVTSLGAVTSNGHILFRNAGDVVVGGDIIANGFDVTLRSNSGSITQTAGNDITSNSLQVIAQTGATLTNAGNAINELAWVDVSSGGFAFSQTGGFQIGGPVLASGQTVSLTSLSGAITQNSGSVLQARTLNASAAGTLTLNQANNVTNLGVISTGGSFLFRDVDGFNLTGNVTAASQVVMLAQSGSIEQTGGIITADDINAMASVDILLGGANQINTISALSASRNLLYRQVGDLSVPTISASGTVSLYSTTGDITQTGTITADTLVLGAGDDFTAADANGLSVGALGLTGNITVGGAMTLVNPGAIFQTSSTAIIAGSLFIDTDGALSATGANSISGNTRLSATGVAFNAVGDLTLQVNVTGFATIVSDGAVEIGGVGASTGDTLSIEAANGISQTQTLTFTNFGNLTNTTAGGIDLTNSSWLNLTGAINAANQYVALNVVTGGILQMSGSTITAQRLGMTTTQGALLGEMNNVAELGDVNVGTHNLLFRTLGDLLIDGDVTSALSVNLTSATGSIGQSAGSDITAGTLYVMAETGISLTNAGNDVGMLGTMINLGSSGGIAYAQTDGFQIDSVVRALNQTVSLTSIAGGISETGTVFAQIEAGTLNISAGGAVTLHRGNDVNNLGVDSAVGGFTFNDTDGFNLTGNVTGGGAVVLDAQAGSIVQTGGVITATSIDAAAAGNLDLGSANVVGAVTALSAGGDILYRQVGNLSVPAITASGSLSLYSTTGSISQTGALSAATLNLGAATGILLGNGGNDIGALGNLSNAPSGNITFLNVDGFDLTGAITAGGSQFVSLSALSGGITQQAGGSITAQALSVVAWDGATLGGDNDVDALGVIIGGPSFVFNDIDDVDISGALNAQAADLTAGGAITQSTGSLNVGTLSLTAASVALDGSNTITMLGDVDVTGNMSLSDVDGITLDGVQAVDGTLALTAGTFVTQQGGGLEVGRLEIDAGTGVAINLTANDIDTLGDITSTSGSISIIKNAFGPLVIDGDISAAASGQTIYINGFASGITMTAAGSLTAGANIDLVAGGNLVLGDINAGGTLNILAAGSSVSSLAAPTIVAARLTGTATAGSFILTGANIDIDQIGNIEVGNTFSITGNNGPLELAGVITAQTVSLGTTGALTQLGGNVDTTTGSFSAGGALTMTTLNSVDTVSLNGASITYNGSGSFAANVVTSTGAVSLTSSGKITQTALTGRIVADSLTASAATGLEFFGGQNDIRLLAGLSSTSGGVTYRDMGGFQITGNIDAAGQTVELVSDGTGADGTDVTQSGGVITANRLQGTSAGDLLFASANVVGQLGYLNAGGNIRYRGAASFTLQDNVNASGGLILNSDTGSIQQFGGSIIANGFAGTAAQGISLSRVNDVNFLGAVDSGAGDFNFRDDNSFDIAGLITSDTSIMLQAGGSINQTSGSIVTGSLSIFTNGAAFLNGAGNDIDNLGLSTVMNGMLFIDIDGFTINDRIFSTALVSLGATTGDILEVAGGYVSSQGLSVYASAGEVDFYGDNVIGTIGDLVADDDLTFHEVDGFTMSGTITGDAIKLTVAGGGINQTGGVITGDSLQVSAVTGISLAQAGNDVDTVLGLSTSSGGITLADADDLRIDGSVTATGQGVAFYVGGDLTQSFTGVITAGMVYGTAGGDFALSDAINTFGQLGTINADRIAINTTGGLNLTSDLTATSGVELKADNFITQSTGAAITGT